jgi:hypothetical protein
MATNGEHGHGEHKRMKKLAFVMVGVAALGLGACNRSNEDAVQNAELNQPSAEDLNELSNQAAMDAANAEAAALGNQQQQLNEENAAAEEKNPTDEQEQNVSGM